MYVLVNLAPLCVSEITLLTNIFVLRRNTAEELGSLSYSSLLPLTVIRTLCISLLSGHRLHMRFSYVTLASYGTLSRGMRNIVLVPDTYCSVALCLPMP